MPDFMDEVRAEVRQQRILDLFEQHKYTLLALAVALVLGTGIGSWYKAHRLHGQEATGAKYVEAYSFLRKDDLTSALPRLNGVIEKGTAGWKGLALLDRASLLAKQKKYDEALESYNVLIADTSADTLLRDMAVVMSAALMMDHDLGDADTIEKRLESMRGDGKAWQYTATELLAVFELRQGKLDKARDLFTGLKDAPLAPVAIQARAEEMLSVLPPAPEKKTEKKKE